MAEKNYSKREQDSFRETMIIEMGKQNVVLDKILEQTSKTNGRVTKLEDKTADYQPLKELVETFKDWKIDTMGRINGATKIIGIILVIIPVIFGAFFTYYMKDLKSSLIQETSANVISTLQAEYNIKITQ